MDVAEALPFLRDNHRSVLVTRRRTGALQTSPVAHAVDDDGRIVISSREPAYKVRNLRRNPTATLCVLPDRFFGEWKQVDGMANIVSLPEAMDGLVDYYRRVAGEHDDWDDYRSAMVRDRRCLIVIDIAQVGPDQAG
jgi:PPOX class probable F420-dependent enzyme